MQARRFLHAVLVALGPLAPGAAFAADSAVVFIYHRFGETEFPSTNVRIEQFKAQIAELAQGGYSVMALPRIVERLKAREPLPDRAVGISIDDAYASTHSVAWPLLRAANMPFTLFVATDSIGNRGMLTWDQLRELKRAGVTIGAHTASHLRMPLSSESQNRDDLERSRQRFEQELGEAPRLFAYPFGEYSLAVRPLVAGFDAAFGQHSGVVHAGGDFLFLPRFSVNEAYGEMARFRLAAQALPLPVRDVSPRDPLIGPGSNPPAFGFTVEASVGAIERLRCYAEGQTVALQRLGERRIEVRPERPFPPGRARLNCTLPGPDGRWRWTGTQFTVTGR
jgi:peptidoglycan/xylan/chitin deacetylase (PgdA/CDA1 family)